MKGKRIRWYSITVQFNTCMDKKIEHVKSKQVEKASKSTMKSFPFMKGKGKMEAMAATGFIRTERQ